MKGRDPAASFDKRQNRVFRSRFPVSAVFGFAANIAFVNLDNFVCSAMTACCRMHYVAHTFAKPMAHEPCGSIGDAEHAMNLMRGHALLASHHKMHGKK